MDGKMVIGSVEKRRNKLRTVRLLYF